MAEKGKNNPAESMPQQLDALRRRCAELEARAEESRTAERALQESEEKYRTLVEYSLQGIAIGQGDPIRIVFANATFADMLGYTVAELLALPSEGVKGLLHPDDREEFFQRYLDRLADRNEPQRSDFRVVRKDGTFGEAEVFGNRIIFCGEPAVQAAFVDISERKNAERALRASEEQYRVLQENLPLGVFRATPEGRLLSVNPAAARIFGYDTVTELLEVPIPGLYADPAQRGLFLHQLKTTGSLVNAETEGLRKDGTTFWMCINVKRITRDEDRNVYFDGIVEDISERRRASDDIRRRNDELALLNQAGREFGASLDMNRVLGSVLEEVRRLLGVMSCSIWIPPDSGSGLVCREATGPQSEIEKGWRLAPGEGFAGWVAQHSESLNVADCREDDRHSVRIDRKRGFEARSILSVPLTVKDSVIGVLQALDTEPARFGQDDLRLVEAVAATASFAIENAKLYEQARRDAKTRNVLLREVNHRVKNNLAIIIGLLHADRRYSQVKTREGYDSMIRDMAHRIQGLATAHDMLALAEWAPIPLSELTEQILGSALRLLPRGKRVDLNVSPSLFRVTHRRAHDLAMMINELAINTVKHGLNGREYGLIDVAIQHEKRIIRFEYRDNGPGYPEDVLNLARHSLGFDLIQDIVKNNLHGELSLRNDDGAVTVVTFRDEPEFEPKVDRKR